MSSYAKAMRQSKDFFQEADICTNLNPYGMNKKSREKRVTD